MHAHRSHRHVQSLSSQTTTPHHSRDSTACAPLLTRAPLVSTPLHAISRIYTAVLNTHIHTHTHTPTKSTCLHTIPLCKRTTLHIHNSHMHRNTVHYTHIPQTPRHTHPHNTVFAPHYSHTHHHTKLVCTYIHPFHVRAQTLHMQLSLHISTSTHTLSFHYLHPPYPHSHTPLHTCSQTHKRTHTSFTPPYSKMLTTLSTRLSLIPRSVLPTCPSCMSPFPTQIPFFSQADHLPSLEAVNSS